MKLSNKLLIAMSAGFIQLGATGNLHAQEVVDLNDVVISATKNDQKQSQTGKVVTIIGREVLDRSHGRSLTDLLNEQAGIVVGGGTLNSGSNKSLFMRGASSGYAVILIDGIPMNNPASIGATFDLRAFSIDQIDRIEILKGGQSTIYGSDAVAGVVNIITKKGSQAGNSVYGVGSYGTYNTYKGTLGMNYHSNDFSYNIAYTQTKTDGISDAANPVGNTDVFDKDGNKTSAVNANFSLKATDQLSISPFIRYFYGNYDTDQGVFKDNPTSYVKLKHFNSGVNTKYDFGTGKINLNYSYENSQLADPTGFVPFSEGKMHLVDLFYNQKLGSKLDVLVGLDNRATRLSTSLVASTNQFSTYASVFAHDLSIFNLEVGGRYNKAKAFGENYTYNITPSINVVKEVKLFGTISTAFKAPNLDYLFTPYGGNLNLVPEESKNYEAGVSLNLAEQKYTLRVSGFKRDLTNAIVYAGNGYINQLKQKVKGFEIEPAAQLGIVNIRGYVAYVEGNEYTYLTSTVLDYLFRRPKNVYAINVGVQATKDLFISTNFKYNSKSYDADYDTGNVVNLDAYKLLGVYAEYTLIKKQLRLFADLKNVLNEKYTEIYGYNSMGFNMNAGLSFIIK
ncbi:MAG: TonB-dependent receptor [Pedobacter sp.]|uniref:TonB-dependent receptor plug domain-containing protein n=1 Tax=Pedobacter sp. TaxID=1411316 RepID=UPI0035654AE4